MNDQVKTEHQNEAHISPSELNDGLADIRAGFERWYMSAMDTSALFEHWSDTDYYEDSDIQRTWRGYQAGVLLSANVKLRGCGNEN